MEKLIIERDESDFYKLEVNDKGDYIEFNLTDIGLPERMMEATEKIKNIDKNYKDNIIKITENKEITELEKAKKIMEEVDLYFKNTDEAFDSFLGEGSCKKIFGNQKCYGQHLKLLSSLEPHFEKMQIKQEKAKRKLAERYLGKDSDVL